MRIPDKQAVFFELDGVLVERAQLDDNGEVPWLPGAKDALTRVDPRIFSIFIATAREDIAMGRMRERDFKKFCERFLTECELLGVTIRKIYSCPYHPKGKARFRKESVFRKPAPGLFKIAQQEFDLNLARCWKIGHRTTDILAGQRAGVGTILVATGDGGKDGTFYVEPHRYARHVRDAVAQIQEFELALRC